MKSNGLHGIEIFLWYACNKKCLFCFQKDLRYEVPKFLPSHEIMEIIDSASKRGIRSVIFSGWEPFLDKNILTYITHAKSIGYEDIRVHTNGTTLVEREDILTFIRAWLSWLVISIHGFWAIHDFLVQRKGSFEMIKRMMVHLWKITLQYPEFTIDTNTVLTRYNYNHLLPLFTFFRYFPIVRSQIVQLYSLHLFSHTEKKDLFVSYDAFRKEIPKILAINTNITLENVPLCKVDEASRYSITDRYRYDSEWYGAIHEDIEESNCIYLEECKKCSLKNKCPWVPWDYLEIFPEDTFTPYTSH